jgi:hypothetical protein
MTLSPYPGIGKLRWVSDGTAGAWEDHLSELADYLQIHGLTAMFLQLQQDWIMGRNSEINEIT